MNSGKTGKLLGGGIVGLSLTGPLVGAALLDGKGNDTFPAFEAAYHGPDGRSVLIETALACDPGEFFQLRVTLTQKSTQALMEGRTHGECTGSISSFTVSLQDPHSDSVVEPGAARALGLVITRDGDTGEVTDAHQWQKDLVIE